MTCYLWFSFWLSSFFYFFREKIIILGVLICWKWGIFYSLRSWIMIIVWLTSLCAICLLQRHSREKKWVLVWSIHNSWWDIRVKIKSRSFNKRFWRDRNIIIQRKSFRSVNNDSILDYSVIFTFIKRKGVTIWCPTQWPHKFILQRHISIFLNF